MGFNSAFKGLTAISGRRMKVLTGLTDDPVAAFPNLRFYLFLYLRICD
jgi:hypothetical protein